MTIRYIADTHWMHRNIVAYDNRPFSSMEEMDEAMACLWNETVKAEDVTYVVGDFCWSQTYEDWAAILSRLNGRVFIVKGNHDRSAILKRLTRNGLILGWSQQEIVKDGENRVILNHSPMPFFINEHQENWAHLYGHVHISYDWNMMLSMHRQIEELYLKKIRMYNVGCMIPYINYIPRTLDEIEEGFKKMDPLQLKFSQNHSWGKKEN